VAFAERTGLIQQLGSWVLGAGCREAARWRTEHPGLPLRLDVNVSTYQLRSPRFVESVHDMLQRTGVLPGDLMLDISENVLMGESDLAHAVLADLRELGVKVALDDFGTGYCSLNHLQRLPLDLLKIDLGFAPEDRAPSLLPPLVGIAHALGLTVLVEGVSTARQRNLVAEAGADQAEGPFFAQPMTVAAVDLLVDGRAADARGRVVLPLGR
jgi:EAL domain-containing protein (putative c-di-GMP-specific phosphodiesterase class I)